MLSLVPAASGTRFREPNYDAQSLPKRGFLISKSVHTIEDRIMRRFLVQVSRDRGATNILDNGAYENEHWYDESRNKDHRKVEQGDQLLVYCTSNVPEHGKKLAFSVDVKAVSSDNVRFDLDTPQFFASPLSREDIQTLVHKGTLPDVFQKCGQQGFNIAMLDSSSAEIVLELLNTR